MPEPTASHSSSDQPLLRRELEARRSRLRSLAGVSLLVLLSSAVGLLAGLGLQQPPAVSASTSDARRENLELFAKALSYVRNNYVDPVDDSALIHGALRGLLSSLDEHSVFMPPRNYRSLQDDTVGEFGGTGLELAIQGRDLVVLAAMDESPAGRAGIRSGDLITSINGKHGRTIRLSDAQSMLRGSPGSKVEVTIFREGSSVLHRLELVREHIRVNPVEWRLIDGKVGYIRIKSFQDHTDRHFAQALGDLRLEAGRYFAGLVLDLRDNPGGLLDQGIKIADHFLSSGTIVSTHGRQGRHQESEQASKQGTEPDYPLVVLINQGSASASEIVAGALQDHGRALLVGQRSFGKGSVQSLIELDDGSAIKLTVARYFTPTGRDIEQKGIEPDIRVSPGQMKAPASRNRLPSHVSPYDLPAVLATRIEGPSSQAGEPEESEALKSGESTSAQGGKPSSSQDSSPPAKRVADLVDDALNQDRQLAVALDLVQDWKNRAPAKNR